MDKGRDPSEPREYEVGYGKPPVASQFKPGNPGRRKGSAKPKTSVSLEHIVKELLERSVRVKRGDQTIEMGAVDLLVARLQKMLTQGSTRDLALLFSLIRQYAPQDKLEEIPLEIIHRRAPGSSVAMPSKDHWKALEE